MPPTLVTAKRTAFSWVWGVGQPCHTQNVLLDANLRKSMGRARGGKGRFLRGSAGERKARLLEANETYIPRSDVKNADHDFDDKVSLALFCRLWK